MKRRLALAVLVVCLPGLLAVLLQRGARTEVEDALQARGLQWGSYEGRVGGLTWRDLTGAGVSVATLDVVLAPWPAVVASGVDLDLAAIDGPPAPAASPSEGAAPALTLAGLANAAVRVEDLDLSWGGEPLLEDLGGPLRPRVSLDGPGGFVRQDADGSWSAQLQRDLELGPLSAAAELSLTCAGTASCDVVLQSEDATLEHPLLAPGPVGPAVLRVRGTVQPRAGTAEGSVRFGDLEALVRRSADGQVDLDARGNALEDVVSLFSPWIPEAAVARVTGTVGFQATLDPEEGRLVALTPSAEGLGAEGAIPNPMLLRRGEFTWRAPIEGGGWVPRTTGEGIAGWTPLDAAGLAPQAMIHAEDAAFSSHGGVHLPAIQDAVDAWIAAPESDLRGGSTITQQLAKNLFCDPLDRTLARKLRELVLSLDLERTLPKRRILELYLNIVELGPEIYGVSAAADAYFIKRPSRMTPTEAVFLAAILPSPRGGYARAAAGRLPRGRMAYILDNMVDGTALTRAEADRAKAAPLRIVPIQR